MGDEFDPADEATPYRWRPAVAPYRPRGISGARPRAPLPGQRMLPGMESDEQPLPAGESGDAEAPPADSLQAHPPSQADSPAPTLTCPNCGSTEFDEDGDCIRCWEPGVAQTTKRPQAREG